MPDLRPVTALGFNLDDAHALAERLRMLADPARLRIIHLLSQRSEMTTVELVIGVGYLSQPTVSHHLKLLREAGLVENLPRGRVHPYRLCPGRLAEVASALGGVA